MFYSCFYRIALCKIFESNKFLTLIFIYIENIFKKFVRFLEKSCGLSKNKCTFVADFLVNKPITIA